MTWTERQCVKNHVRKSYNSDVMQYSWEQVQVEQPLPLLLLGPKRLGQNPVPIDSVLTFH